MLFFLFRYDDGDDLLFPVLRVDETSRIKAWLKSSLTPNVNDRDCGDSENK